MAVGQSLICQLTHRYRGQAPSHILIYILSVQYGSAGSLGFATTGYKQPRQHHQQAQNARRDELPGTVHPLPYIGVDRIAASQALTNSAD